MQIPEKKLQDFLIKAGVIDQETWDDVSRNAHRLGNSIEDMLKEKDIISGSLLYQIVAKGLGVKYVDLHTKNVSDSALQTLTGDTVSKFHVIPFELNKKSKTLKLAFVSPWTTKDLTALKKKSGYKVEPFFTDIDSFRHVSNYYKKEVAKKIKSNIDSKKKSANAKALFDLLIKYVYYTRPSDIHIEMFKDEGWIKLRIDGFLMDKFEFPLKATKEIVNLIKQYSNVKNKPINQDNDGRFEKTIFGEELAFRISILPTFHGEKICMRVLDKSKQKLSLRDLGFRDKDLDLIKTEFQKPYGLILVNGPTGAGKSTTLYAFLKFLNEEGVSIATIEDPVEYPIRHVNQSQVNLEKNYTFAKGLEKLMRQDPDIVVIGEIRDKETANTTVQAALTGHIILSTIHSNTAIGTVTRLKDMGIESYLLAPTMNMAVSQRLVKKTCTYCRESYVPEKDYLNKINKDTKLYRSLTKLKVQGLLSNDDPSRIRLYKSKGCEKCGFKGYKGRVGVFEILKIDDQITEMILNDRSEADIQRRAEANGMLTLFEDGLLKAMNGLTSIEEILNVIK